MNTKWFNTLAMPEVPVPLPHPTYHIPRDWFILRRNRRRQIPVPRNPFTHFLSDCISQQISALENRTSQRDAMDTVLGIWLRMSNEQRTPWIQMTQRDMNMIAYLAPYYAECPRRGRQIASGATNRGPANERSQAASAVDHLRLLHISLEVRVGPRIRLPPIVLFHGRRPLVLFQPVLITGCTRRQDNPTTFPEITATSGSELPFLEAHRAHYATPMRFSYQEQGTNRDQHEEVNSSGSSDSFTTTETQADSSNLSSEQVEPTFLEVQRNRCVTPVRSTYCAPFTTGSTAD